METSTTRASKLRAGRLAPAVVLVSSDPSAGRGPLPFVAKEELLSADLHALARPAATATY